MKRRAFLRYSAGAATLGAVTPLAGCGGLAVLSGTVVRGSVNVSRAEFDTFAGDGNAIGVDVGSAFPILLVRDSGGRFHAVSSRCTHQACRVKPARGFLSCPCHGSTFELDGTVVRGPAQSPLSTFPVRETGDGFVIELEGG